MLYLTRKKGETIYAFMEDGKCIEINIMGFSNSCPNAIVTIGINAPKDVKLVRHELLDELQYKELCNHKSVEKIEEDRRTELPLKNSHF